MLHFPWTDVNRIIQGCRKIVEYQENVLYDRNFRLSKNRYYLALLSINDHLLSDNQNDFRRKEVIDWLPQDLRNITPGIISHRHLNWLIKIHVLRRQQDFYCRFGRPGRHGKNDKEILSGPKKFYSQSGFILYLQKLVHQITPKSIIYTVLRQSKMLERFLKLCEYKALLVVKNTDVDDMIKQTKMIIPFPELAFDRNKYLSNKKILSSFREIRRKSYQ